MEVYGGGRGREKEAKLQRVFRGIAILAEESFSIVVTKLTTSRIVSFPKGIIKSDLQYNS